MATGPFIWEEVSEQTNEWMLGSQVFPHWQHGMARCIERTEAAPGRHLWVRGQAPAVCTTQFLFAHWPGFFGAQQKTKRYIFLDNKPEGEKTQVTAPGCSLRFENEAEGGAGGDRTRCKKLEDGFKPPDKGRVPLFDPCPNNFGQNGFT